MHLKDLQVAMQAFEAFEAIEPDIVKIAGAFASAEGRKPTLRELKPQIVDAVDKTLDGPVGDITV